jgi:hypothetical protein
MEPFDGVGGARGKFRREAQPAYEVALPDGETPVLTCVWPRLRSRVATKPPHSMLSGTSQGFLTIVRASSTRTMSCTNQPTNSPKAICELAVLRGPSGGSKTTLYSAHPKALVRIRASTVTSERFGY